VTELSPFKYNRTLLAFMGILLIFLVSVDVLIVSKQRRLLMEEVRSHMEGELNLMGTFVREPLLKQDYSKIEQFLTQWAEEHDEVIAVKATMPNDFVLLEYETKASSSNTYSLEQKVQYAGRELITLKVTRDFSKVERILSRLQMQLIAGSFILIFILGAVLWRTVKKMAMIPLEKEIILRRENEDMLKKARDELEVRVQERTRELNDINQDLLQEIAERRRIEDALLESEEKYRLLVENTETGFVVVDDKGFIVEANEPYLHLTGERNFSDVLGRSVIEWTAPESKEKNSAAMARCVEEGSIQDFETVYLHSDGSRINILVNATMHETSYGKRLTALCRDITERKKIEKDRERLNIELALKNRELEQIIYASSHDLRTPLVNIHGFSKELKNSIDELTSMVRSSLPSEDIRKNADSIVEIDIAESLKYITLSVTRMDSLLTGLLRLSRLGRDKLKIEPLDMHRLLSDVLSIFEFRLKDGNVKTEISDLPACMGDELQLNQVFSNLIENALKYLGNGKAGHIRISGYKENDQSVYCVEDNGIGIEPEYRDKIFEIFHQLEPENSSGEGLGLTIVQRILQRHQGKIWLESESGTGSKFYISLPGVS
jgi:PAS domain S-box-containing protein